MNTSFGFSRNSKNYINNHYIEDDFSYKYNSDDDDDESIIQNNIFHANNIINASAGDTELFFPMDVSYMESEGRVSLAYERLTQIPKQIADKFAKTTHTLDLSHNSIKDLSFLASFENLTTLILDKNDRLKELTLPYLPELKILWINNCKIQNITNWLQRIQICCPNIKYLSLLGNPGSLSTFNGGTMLEHVDFRMFILSMLPKLQWLDDTQITDAQRCLANSNRDKYSLNGGQLKFVERFGTSAPWLNLFQYNKDQKQSSTDYYYKDQPQHYKRKSFVDSTKY